MLIEGKQFDFINSLNIDDSLLLILRLTTHFSFSLLTLVHRTKVLMYWSISSLFYFFSSSSFLCIKIQHSFFAFFHYNHMTSIQWGPPSKSSVRWDTPARLEVIDKSDAVLENSRRASKCLFVILFNEEWENKKRVYLCFHFVFFH